MSKNTESPSAGAKPRCACGMNVAGDSSTTHTPAICHTLSDGKGFCWGCGRRLPTHYDSCAIVRVETPAYTAAEENADNLEDAYADSFREA